jgi:oligosaccharide repeat unit polymerase
MNDNYAFLFVIYSIVGLVVLVITIANYLRNRKLSGILIVRIMYLIIYSIVPISTLTAINNGTLAYKMRALDLTENGLNELLLMSVFSFIGYLSLEMGYKANIKFVIHRKSTIYSAAQNNFNRDYSSKRLNSAAIIMSIISIVALFMWSASFGGIAGVMQFGRTIRSGYTVENISNSMGFMKHFVPFGLFASIIFLALYRTEKRAIFFIEFLIMFIVSVIYSVANDGRAPFMMYLVSILILWWMTAKKRYTQRNKVWMIIIVIIAFLLITNMDNILSFLRTGTYGTQQTDSGIFTFLADEFSFTVRNAQSSQEALKDGETFRLLKDIVAAIFSLLPSRFTPEGVVKLQIINTQYWMGNFTYYGGKPTDLMAASLYELWYLGIIIWPFIYGLVVKKLDTYFEKSRDTIYGKILFVQLIYQFAKTVGYADLSLIALNVFYLVLCHLIVMICCPKLDESQSKAW